MKHRSMLILGMLITFSACAMSIKVERKDRISSLVMGTSHFAWITRNSIHLSSPDQFPKYSTREIPTQFKGVSRLAWSGDGKVLYAVGAGHIVRYELLDGKLILSGSLTHKQLTGFILNPSINGNTVVVSFDGERTPERWPGWRAAVELKHVGGKMKIGEFLTSKDDGVIASLVLRDKQDRLYYAPKESNRRFVVKNGKDIKPFTDNKARFCTVSPDGNHAMFCARSPDHKSTDGSNLWTMYVAKVTDGKLGPLNGVLLPHKDHIAWGYLFADNNTLMWRHYVRGKDGNKIIKRQIMTSTLKDGKWGPHRVEFEIPNKQVWGMGLTDKHIVTLDTDNRITLYDRTRRKAKPRTLKFDF